MPSEQTTYFHCSPITLSPGSIIHPGNWGRVLHLYETNNPTQVQLNAIREALLELSRQAIAPNKPKRIESVFTLLNLGDAIAFRNKHQRTSVIHEVVPVVENPNTHLGDYEIAITPFQGQYFQQMFDFPRAYWTTTQPQFPEMLFDCEVRVVSVPSVPPLPNP
jgi:hypothetical protein